MDDYIDSISETPFLGQRYDFWPHFDFSFAQDGDVLQPSAPDVLPEQNELPSPPMCQQSPTTFTNSPISVMSYLSPSSGSSSSSGIADDGSSDQWSQSPLFLSSFSDDTHGDDKISLDETHASPTQEYLPPIPPHNPTYPASEQPATPLDILQRGIPSPLSAPSPEVCISPLALQKASPEPPMPTVYPLLPQYQSQQTLFSFPLYSLPTPDSVYSYLNSQYGPASPSSSTPEVTPPPFAGMLSAYLPPRVSRGTTQAQRRAKMTSPLQAGTSRGMKRQREEEHEVPPAATQPDMQLHSIIIKTPTWTCVVKIFPGVLNILKQKRLLVPSGENPDEQYPVLNAEHTSRNGAFSLSMIYDIIRHAIDRKNPHHFKHAVGEVVKCLWPACQTEFSFTMQPTEDETSMHVRVYDLMERHIAWHSKGRGGAMCKWQNGYTADGAPLYCGNLKRQTKTVSRCLAKHMFCRNVCVRCGRSYARSDSFNARHSKECCDKALETPDESASQAAESNRPSKRARTADAFSDITNEPSSSAGASTSGHRRTHKKSTSP